MQIQLTPELIYHAVETLVIVIGGAGSAWIGMRIQTAVAAVRAEQTVVKADLVDRQNDLRADLHTKHAENQAQIREHAASDEQQFKYIGESLKRIEDKVERRNHSGA